MKVLFFCQDASKVEQLAVALRMRWPDLATMTAPRGRAGLDLIVQAEPDLVVFREDLPDLNIWTAIRELRQFSDIPIVVAVEGGGEVEVVKALELGADDHIRLPRDLMEIVARIAAIMRRVGRVKQRDNGSLLRCGELLINCATHEVFLGKTTLALTPTEFRLLCLLAKNRQVTLPQDYIQRAIWSDEIDAGEALKKYVQRLRRKLGDDARNPAWIKTVYGVGYRFSSPVPDAA